MPKANAAQKLKLKRPRMFELNCQVKVCRILDAKFRVLCDFYTISTLYLDLVIEWSYATWLSQYTNNFKKKIQTKTKNGYIWVQG